MKRSSIVAVGIGAILAFAGSANAATFPIHKSCELKISAAASTHFTKAYAAYQTCFIDVLAGKQCDPLKLIKALNVAGHTLKLAIYDKTCSGLGTTPPNPVQSFGTQNSTLAALGFLPNAFVRDSSENPGATSGRELANSIALANLASVGEALTRAWPCVVNDITLASGSQTVVQFEGLALTIPLTGSTQICYSGLNYNTTSKVFATTGVANKHIVYVQPGGADLDPVILTGIVKVCVGFAGVSAGSVDCSGDSKSTKGPNFNLMQDESIGTGASNLISSTNELCSINFLGGDPYDAACISAGGKKVIPAYGTKTLTTTCQLGALSSTGQYPCLEADSDGTSGASAGDGTNKFFVNAGCNANSFALDAGVCNSGVNVTQGSGKCISTTGLASTELQPCVTNFHCYGDMPSDLDTHKVKCVNKGTIAGDLSMVQSIKFDLKDIGGADDGADSIPCTDDDALLGSVGAPTSNVATSGTGWGNVVDANAGTTGIRIQSNSTDCGGPCVADVDGDQFSCTELLAGSGLTTGGLAGAFPTIDALSFGSQVTTFQFLP